MKTLFPQSSLLIRDDRIKANDYDWHGTITGEAIDALPKRGGSRYVGSGQIP